MKTVLICMTIGAAALAGLPPFSGFFSKERILWDLSLLPNPVWLIAGMIGVFLTAYYAFRLIFVLLSPGIRPGGTVKEGGHGALSGSMLWPLIILAAATVLLGFAQGPLESFLESVRGVAEATHPAHPPWLLPVSFALALAGVVLAWIEFGRKAAARIGIFEKIKPLHRLFSKRWYIDHIYRFLLEYLVYKGITRLFTRNEHRVIEGGIAALCRGALESGGIVSRLHAGMIQYRLIATFAVIVLLGLFFFV
jgi:NADH-quinone oxidoreductase subunit L